jgi:Pyridoxamine 5'-phosphate oxidase
MDEPRASRPWMPGYGTLPEHEGTGLLPWSWALEQLKTSHNYWLVTADARGGPHLMPVWAVWDGGIMWFSSSRGSRKVRNLRADPRCVLSTEDANNPMIMRGTAELVTMRPNCKGFLISKMPNMGRTMGWSCLTLKSTASFDSRPPGPSGFFRATSRAHPRDGD